MRCIATEGGVEEQPRQAKIREGFERAWTRHVRRLVDEAHTRQRGRKTDETDDGTRGDGSQEGRDSSNTTHLPSSKIHKVITIPRFSSWGQERPHPEAEG